MAIALNLCSLYDAKLVASEVAATRWRRSSARTTISLLQESLPSPRVPRRAEIKHIPQRAFQGSCSRQVCGEIELVGFRFHLRALDAMCVCVQRVATGVTKVERLIFYQTAFHVDLVVEALKCQRFVLTEDFLAWLNSIKVLKVSFLVSTLSVLSVRASTVSNLWLRCRRFERCQFVKFDQFSGICVELWRFRMRRVP